VAKVTNCIAIDDDVAFDQAAACFANPLTAILMLELVQKKKHKAVISTAAAGALGRMIQKYFTQNGIRVINVVRRPEQIEILKKDGAQFVLDSNDENFLQNLKNLATEYQATCCFEAISGPLTG